MSGGYLANERQSLRLVEAVGVKGHMDGFTLSRVWDRAL